MPMVWILGVYVYLILMYSAQEKLMIRSTILGLKRSIVAYLKVNEY